jgi:hypothetical protein
MVQLICYLNDDVSPMWMWLHLDMGSICEAERSEKSASESLARLIDFRSEDMGKQNAERRQSISVQRVC